MTGSGFEGQGSGGIDVPLFLGVMHPVSGL